MKKVLISIFSGVLINALLVVVICVAVIAAIVSSNNQNSDNSDVIASNLQEFIITGTADGDIYDLTFKFETWSIDNIILNMPGEKGTASATVQVPEFSGTHEEMAYQFLRQNGFTPEGACGLMANIKAESGFKETVIERTSRADKGYGICQWTFGRRSAIEKWLENKGLDPYESSDELFLAQLEYAITEPGYEDIVNRMKVSTDVTEATKIWCVEWERPASMYAQAASRASNGRKYLETFGSSGLQPSGETRSAKLTIDYEVVDGEIYFSGKLDGTDIAGSFEVKDGRVSGRGDYGEGASAGGSIGNPYGDSNFYITDIACAHVPGHTNSFHNGWDLALGGDSTPIYAVTSGTVVTAGSISGFGNHSVIVKSGNMYVLYGDMSSMAVSEGDSVKRGQRIGNQGNEGNSSGSHLHLEFRRGSNSSSNSTANLNGMKPMLQRWASNYASYKDRFGEIER